MSDLFGETRFAPGDVVVAINDQSSICRRRDVVAGTEGWVQKSTNGLVLICVENQIPPHWFDEQHWVKK